MPTTFRNVEDQSEFDRRGFIVRRLVDRHDADALRTKVCEATKAAACMADGQILANTFLNPDLAVRQQVSATVAAMLGPRLLSLLGDYRLLESGVLTKPAGHGAMMMHRDRDFLADRDRASIVAWCPLVDVDRGNGGLALLPGSHRLPNVETEGVSPFYRPYADKLQRLCTVPRLAAGEAVLFHNRLLHGSLPNHASGDRIVTRLNAIPKDGRLVTYQLDHASNDTRFALVALQTDDDGVPLYNPNAAVRAGADGQIVAYAPNDNRRVSFSECSAVVARANNHRIAALAHGMVASLETLWF